MTNKPSPVFCIAALSIFLVAAAPPPGVPDQTLTPGAVRSDVHSTAAPGVPDQNVRSATVCTTKWGKDERAVTASMKRRVFLSYGFPQGNKDPRCPCEIDHRVPRELLGADVMENLWVERYAGPWNARMKDRLENRVHKEVCDGRMSLKSGQKVFLEDWRDGYRKFFGEQ